MELAGEGVGMTINITGVMRDWMTERAWGNLSLVWGLEISECFRGGGVERYLGVKRAAGK